MADKHIVTLDFDLLRDVFDFAADAKLVGFGGEGLVFRDRGEIVKCYYATPDCDIAMRQHMIRTEAEALRNLGEVSASHTYLCIPEFIDVSLTGQGDELPVWMPGREADTRLLGYIRSSEVPGSPLLLREVSHESLPVAVAEFGQAQAEMHNMLAAAYAGKPLQTADVLGTEKLLMAQHNSLLASGRDLLPEAASRLADLPWGVVHGDAHDGNFLALPHGAIISVVDWSCVAHAPLALDAYKLFSDWNNVDDRAGAYLPDFVEAYNAVATTRMDLRDIFATGIAYTAGNLATAQNLPELREFAESEMATLRGWIQHYTR